MSDRPTLPPATPIYLGSGPDAAFGMYHDAPDGVRAATAVLLTPPWGWDDVSSYRARRTWADDLAAAGHPTLRIDLPGTGDSGGSALDGARIDAAVSAVSKAVAWLRSSSGCERVAVIGLGLGGLVTARALDAGAAIDDLVLWAVPARGRALVRQLRAFAGLQGSRYSLTGEPEPPVLPDGWLEVNGFVLSADTIAAIESIVLADVSARGLARALLLDQDGIPTDPAVTARLTADGVDVTLRPGPGWGAMTFHPERPSVPGEVLATVRTWLADAPGRVVPLRAPAPTVAAQAELDHSVDGVVVREMPVFVDGPAGRLFGILTRPATAAGVPIGGVFLNAGAVRRIGPNRIWVDTARRWAARGVATLRLDLEGIGDSDGDEERYRDVAQFYVRDEVRDHIRGAIDALVNRGHGPRIILAGLCAGGFWAFRGADADERVTAAFLLNPGALEWHPQLVEARQAARLHRLRRPDAWRRILRGGVPMTRMGSTARAALRQTARSIAAIARRALGRRPVGQDGDPTSAAAILDRLSVEDTTVVLAFSADEPLYIELERDGFLAQAHRWPTLRLDRLPGRDHTLRPIAAQRAAHALLDRELGREIDRIASAPPARSA